MTTIEHGDLRVLLCDDGSVQIVNEIDMRIKVELSNDYTLTVTTDPATGRFLNATNKCVQCFETRKSMNLRRLGK